MSTHARHHRTFAAVLLPLTLGLLPLAACEDKSAPPSAGAGQSNPLDNLADNPTSLVGRSAAQGRDLAGKIGREQDQASTLAGEITGQGGVMVGNLRFKPPADWEAQTADPSKFQSAAYLIRSEGAEGQVVFFGSIGGNVASNIERWRAQVKKPDGSKADAKVDESTVNGRKVTNVSIDGVYQGMSGPAITDAGFRASLIEMAPGQMICIRLTGPRDLVQAHTDEFFAMVKTAASEGR